MGRGQRKAGPPTSKPRLPGESGGRAMAGILVDPCNGNVNVDMYPGPRASMCTRYKSRLTWTGSSSGNDTAFALAYHPAEGFLRFQNETGYTTAVTEASAGRWYRQDGLAPGNSYLNNILYVASRRAKAGCAGISWTGTELNRVGGIHMDLVNGGQLWEYLDTVSGGGGSATSIANMTGALSHTERTPKRETEITWAPGEGDRFMQTRGQASSLDYAEKNAFAMQTWIVILGTSFTAGAVSNIMVTLTSVVDSNWSQVSGIPQVQANVASPRQLVTDILAKLRQKDTMWYINSARKVGTLLAGLI